MSFTQANIHNPCCVYIHNPCCVYLPNSKSININRNPNRNSLRFAPLLKHHRLRCSPVCLHGSKDKSGKDEEFPWQSLKKDVGNFKGKSVEEVLFEQIEKKEFYNGGSSNKPPHGGDSGGGNNGGSSNKPPRGGDSGSGKNGDGSEDTNDLFQIVLATLGFLFLYVFFINGPELTLLARDFICYLFKGTKSGRLRRVLNKWKSFLADAA